jgi:hypothetical protein
MHITIVSPAKAGANLVALAERRLRFVLRRRADAVPVATVRLEDVNGPRGGPDKQCRVSLRTNGSGTVVASAIATTWRGAMYAALTRAAHLLARLTGRAREGRRTALPAPDKA